MIAHASAKSEVRRAKHTFHAESAAEGGTWAQFRMPPRGCSSKLNMPVMPSRPQKEVRGDDCACHRDTWGKVCRADHACRVEETTEGVCGDNRARRRYAAGSVELSTSAALCRPRSTGRAPRGRRSAGMRTMKHSKTDTHRRLLFLTLINFLARMSMRPIWWTFKQ